MNHFQGSASTTTPVSSTRPIHFTLSTESSSRSTRSTTTTATTPASAYQHFPQQEQQQQQQVTPNNSNHILRQTPPSASSSVYYQTPSIIRRRSTTTPNSAIGASSSSNNSSYATNSYSTPGLQQQQQQDLQQRYPYHHSESRRHSNTLFDSPFASPPPTVHRGAKSKVAPLVLDAASAVQPQTLQSASSSTTATSHSTHSRTTPSGAISRLLEAASRQSSSSSTHSRQQQQQQQASEPPPPSQNYSAPVLSKQVGTSQVGFLQKLGTTIPEFKRRFFVLKASTHLYYYLSPSDEEPRGRVDVEGSQVEHIETLSDGRYRFALIWPLLNHKRIVFEARTEEIGQEWVTKLTNERVSTLSHQVDTLTSHSQAQQARIQELERQVQELRHVEQDRDGALEDARQWKAQFETLDEALRRLSLQIQRAPSIQETKKSKSETNNDSDKKDKNDEQPSGGEEEKKEDDNDADNMSNADTQIVQNGSSKEDPNMSLLDTEEGKATNDSATDDDFQWDTFNVPGTYFASLTNACQQQRESLRLAALEATTAVEDLQEANANVEQLQKRMGKAEKQLVKLWEENCAIRKTLKQKKREKRVLVKEVKNLQEQLVEEQNRPRPSPPKQRTPNSSRTIDHTLLGSDEEQLIVEIEEHVAKSIQLNQKIIDPGHQPDDDPGTEADLNTSIEGSEVLPMAGAGSRLMENAATIRFDGSSSVSTMGGRMSPLAPKLLSLMDDEESSGAEGDEAYINSYENIYDENELPSVSSIGAEFGDDYPITSAANSVASGMRLESIQSGDSSPDRANPVLKLLSESMIGEEDENMARNEQRVASRVTETGHATSRLVCPLADVVEMKSKFRDQGNADLEVYHLTFYSERIGIQFQKAPPGPVQPRGLLTEAMTADLGEAPSQPTRTDSELKRLSAIRNLTSKDVEHEDVCPVATPKDIVLVCGFEGFDDSGSNPRPSLGARLVAFDGISVEVGPWTFDSIRKAIKARQRPMTLSFRNDFLTTEQRAILTKAIGDTGEQLPPVRQITPRQRAPSTTPSIASALSHDSDNFASRKEYKNGHNDSEEADLSAMAHKESKKCIPRHAMYARDTLSACSRRTSACGSSVSSQNSTSNHSKFRTFSEGGASSVSASAASLVANLMKNVSGHKRSEKKSTSTPSYLTQDAESVEGSQQHKDFQSNLL
jgi:hypothetical protein